MQDWDDFRFFLAVARSGSITAAAEILHVNQSTVSRRINAFENRMNVRLFDRLATGYELTPEGNELARFAGRMKEESEAAYRRVMGGNISLSGPLRVTTSLVGLHYFLLPYIKEFNERHPEIDLHWDLSNNLYNLGQREADVALRLTREPLPDNLIARELGKITFGVYGAKHYLATWRENKDIQALHWIGEDINDSHPAWLPRDIGPLKRVMRSNDVLATVDLLKIGLGVGRLPHAMGRNEAELECLDVPVPVAPVPVFLLTHLDMRRVQRVKIFTDFIAKSVKALLTPQ